jgi:predicted Zn-dependent protease
LGLALSNLGRGEEAEQVLAAALQRYPESAAHWLVLGQTQLKLGKASESETSLRKALELGLDSADLFFALGNACAQQGKQEEAAQAREQFARRKASAPLAADERFAVLSLAEAKRTAVAVMLEAAIVHAWQQDSLEAERLLLRAIAIEPTSAASCHKLAQIYREAGLAAEQRAVVERLVQLERLNLAHYLELARLSAELDEPEAAEAALKLAISVAPDNAAPYTTLARFYLQEQQLKKARWYAQESVRREPTAERYVLLASTCRLLGDQATAEAALAEAQRLAAGAPANVPEKESIP